RVQVEWRRIPRANPRLDVRRAAADHGASAQEGGSPGHLVPPRLDVGSESEWSFCRLEPQRQVRGRVSEASLDRISCAAAIISAMISAAGLRSLIFRTLSSPAGNPIRSNSPVVSGVGTAALDGGLVEGT